MSRYFRYGLISAHIYVKRVWGSVRVTSRSVWPKVWQKVTVYFLGGSLLVLLNISMVLICAWKISKRYAHSQRRLWVKHSFNNRTGLLLQHHPPPPYQEYFKENIRYYVVVSIPGFRDPGHFPSGFNPGIQDRDPDLKNSKNKSNTASVIWWSRSFKEFVLKAMETRDKPESSADLDVWGGNSRCDKWQR